MNLTTPMMSSRPPHKHPHLLTERGRRVPDASRIQERASLIKETLGLGSKQCKTESTGPVLVYQVSRKTMETFSEVSNALDLFDHPRMPKTISLKYQRNEVLIDVFTRTMILLDLLSSASGSFDPCAKGAKTVVELRTDRIGDGYINSYAVTRYSILNSKVHTVRTNIVIQVATMFEHNHFVLRLTLSRNVGLTKYVNKAMMTSSAGTRMSYTCLEVVSSFVNITTTGTGGHTLNSSQLNRLQIL